ncbi:hypothetical protein BSKO_09579 [Bryopsis sp. KO-2023]|nr:hypothetical protein BSKO_09579 [Bryopsis sp. KO-2023]
MSDDARRPLLGDIRSLSVPQERVLTRCLQKGKHPNPKITGRVVDSASEFVMPRYHSDEVMTWYANLREVDNTPHEIDACLTEMELDVGYEIVNEPAFAEGRTLFLQLVQERKMAIVEALLEYAITQKNGISLESVPAKHGYRPQNAVQISIDTRSPEIVQLIVRYALLGACDLPQMSAVFSESLCRLLEKQDMGSNFRFGHITLSFRTIFTDAIADKSFLIPMGEVQIPESAFHSSKDPYLVGLHQDLAPREKTLWQMWREMEPKLADFTDDDYEHAIKISAQSYLVPYSNIAKPGMDGVLRPILFLGCQDRVFKSLPVTALIKWKWEKYAFRLAKIQMVKCVSLMLAFTAYSLSFITCGRVNCTRECEITMGVFLGLSSLLAWILLIGEIRQLAVYMKDGTKYRHKHYCWLSPSAGLHYWLYTKWNVMEMMSFLLVAIVIPALHFLSEVEHVLQLSGLIGATGVLLWWKMLYYLQLFEKTSPLVTMIFDIAKDMMAFVLIAIFLLMGFALGFMVLFQSETGEVSQEFSTLSRGCLTLFAYLLGAFDLEEFASTRYPSVTFGMFISYEMTMTIVLLNLLIAIMGDSFDRIKEREATTFLMAKAAITEDMECISYGHVKKIDIPKYMHIVVPTHSSSKADEGDQWWAPNSDEVWQGRMVHLERKLRGLMQESTRKTRKEIVLVSETLESKLESMGATMEKLEASGTYHSRSIVQKLDTTLRNILRSTHSPDPTPTRRNPPFASESDIPTTTTTSPPGEQENKSSSSETSSDLTTISESEPLEIEMIENRGGAEGAAPSWSGGWGRSQSSIEGRETSEPNVGGRKRDDQSSMGRTAELLARSPNRRRPSAHRQPRLDPVEQKSHEESGRGRRRSSETIRGGMEEKWGEIEKSLDAKMEELNRSMEEKIDGLKDSFWTLADLMQGIVDDRLRSHPAVD